jgi:uncharacterized protein YqhQ
MTDKLPTYGGQAVIEGVMMRGTRSVAIAMRSPNREIVLHTEDLGGIYKSRISKIPFLRGLIALWDALGLGMRALTISANTQTGEDEKLEGPALYLTLGLALAFGIGLFFLAPAAVGQLLEHTFAAPARAGGPQAAGGLAQGLAAWSGWLGNLFEGIIRLLLLVVYIWAVGKIPEIRRVFAYHGAEHKTINAFEAGAELTPESVARFSLEHPRCGTAFLLTLVFISVLVFSILGPMPLALRLASRVLLLPVLAGMAYEYIRWTAKNLGSPLVRLLIRPNLALQHMTTREPSLDMLEVAIAAFNAMRAGERVAEQPGDQTTAHAVESQVTL